MCSKLFELFSKTVAYLIINNIRDALHAKIDFITKLHTAALVQNLI